MQNSQHQNGKISLAVLVPFLIFVLILVFLGIGLQLNPRLIPSNKINKPAPEFTLPLLYTPEQSFSPRSLLGKKWVLNVWASWCRGCLLEHKWVSALAKQTSVPIVGLNYKDKPTDAKKWLLSYGNPYSYIVSDTIGDTAIDWGVYGAPETFIVNEKGLIIYKHIGPIDQNTLTQKILPLLL